MSFQLESLMMNSDLPKIEGGVTLILAVCLAALFYLVGCLEGMIRVEDKIYESCRQGEFRTDFYVLECKVKSGKDEL